MATNVYDHEYAIRKKRKRKNIDLQIKESFTDNYHPYSDHHSKFSSKKFASDNLIKDPLSLDIYLNHTDYAKVKKEATMEELKFMYKYECFRLNLNCFFDTVSQVFPTPDTEFLLDSYSSCLDYKKSLFNNVGKIESNSSDIGDLEYNPMIDDLPNFSNLSEIEISLLQKLCCGCKSLSWNEYNAMFVISTKSELTDSQNPESSSYSSPSTNYVKIPHYFQDLTIDDSKLHGHRQKETSLKSTFLCIDDFIASESCDETSLEEETYVESVFKDEECDPFNDVGSVDVLDEESIVKYISHFDDDINVVMEIVPIKEPIDIVGMIDSDLEDMKKRLDSYRLIEVADESLPVDEPIETTDEVTNAPINVLQDESDEQSTSDGEFEINAVSITESEFTSGNILSLDTESGINGNNNEYEKSSLMNMNGWYENEYFSESDLTGVILSDTSVQGLGLVNKFSSSDTCNKDTIESCDKNTVDTCDITNEKSLTLTEFFECFNPSSLVGDLSMKINPSLDEN